MLLGYLMRGKCLAHGLLPPSFLKHLVYQGLEGGETDVHGLEGAFVFGVHDDEGDLIDEDALVGLPSPAERSRVVGFEEVLVGEERHGVFFELAQIGRVAMFGVAFDGKVGHGLDLFAAFPVGDGAIEGGLVGIGKGFDAVDEQHVGGAAYARVDALRVGAGVGPELPFGAVGFEGALVEAFGFIEVELIERGPKDVEVGLGEDIAPGFIVIFNACVERGPSVACIVPPVPDAFRGGVVVIFRGRVAYVALADAFADGDGVEGRGHGFGDGAGRDVMSHGVGSLVGGRAEHVEVERFVHGNEVVPRMSMGSEAQQGIGIVEGILRKGTVNGDVVDARGRFKDGGVLGAAAHLTVGRESLGILPDHDDAVVYCFGWR